MTDLLTDLRYPIGPMPRAGADTDEARAAAIAAIAAAPARFRAALAGLTDAQLDTPYRPGGWTVRQVAHHLPDSHLNAYVRFKLALTEVEPTIKPYDETRWAELPEARTAPVEMSLRLLEAIHERWVAALRALPTAGFDRTFWHPEQQRRITLKEQLAHYAWHSAHHTAHVTALRAREGWA